MFERNVTENNSSQPFNPKLIVAIIVLALIGFMLFNSIYIVDQTEEAVVLTFGQYSRTEGPGMKFKIPFIEHFYKVPTKQVQKLDFGSRTINSDDSQQRAIRMFRKNESSMLTGDLNIVDITWNIQYRIVDPRLWLFNIEAQAKEQTIRDIAKCVVNQLVGDRAILNILGNERQNIEAKSTEMMNDIFNTYQIGVLVTGTQLKDILPPEGSVKAAFDDVNVAFQDMNRLINEGREKYNKEIPRAVGIAQQTIQVAEGYGTERINKAIGDVARFKAVLTEYRRNPEVMRNRLYIETIEEIFKNNENTDLLDKKLANVLPLKNLGINPTIKEPMEAKN